MPKKVNVGDESRGSGQVAGWTASPSGAQAGGDRVCLSNALRLETYIGDTERAGDSDLAEFFRKAQADSRKGGEMGKEMLRGRLSS